MARPKTCLLTAATDDFVPGTFVMVRTFLKHHPRFGGDVVVHDGLSDASREALAASFHRLRFEPVSPWTFLRSGSSALFTATAIGPKLLPGVSPEAVSGAQPSHE